jgi:hypothetical protein
MDAHTLIFGDKLERCVVHITNEACKANTREAYKLAHSKLHGIVTLLVFMSSEGGVPMPTGHLMVRNEMSNIQRIIDSPTGILPKKATV